MRREVFKGAFLFVEGPSDGRFYGMFVDQNVCQIIIAYNRFNVIETCRILEGENFKGTIGIIDADFDHLEEKIPDVSSVFQTDLHDSECFMLSTKAFEKLLSECASQEKLKAWQKTYVSDVRGHLLQQAAITGGLLWHSNRTGLGLCFRDLEVKEYVDEAGLKIDIPQFIKHVKNKSQKYDSKNEQLAVAIQERLEASDKIWQIVRGHDLVDLLSFAFRKTLGNWKAQEVTREHIERGLRLAYSEDDFFQTEIFSKIRAWEATNPPFRIFRYLPQVPLSFASQKS